MIRQSTPFAWPFVLALLVCCQPCGSRAQAEPADAFDPAAQSSPSKEVIGWVTPTSARRRDAAPYALTDKAGNVGYYLRPADGVQLERFVNIKVRLRGSEGTLDDEPTPLLQVEQVGPPDKAIGPRSPRNQAASRPVSRKQTGQGPSLNPQRSFNRDVRQAALQEPTVAPEPIPDSFGDVAIAPIPETGNSEDIGQNFAPGNHPACGGCNLPSCPSCCDNGCGIPGNFWVRAEYLYWWTEGMHVPPLVTTGPSAAQPGFLGSPGTQILFGGNSVNGGGRSGGRITAGMWLDPCRKIGVQGDYFSLASVTTKYSASSPGDPILSRPFFDVRPTLSDQNVEQVASPGVIAGTVSVTVPTQFSSAGVNMLFNLCCCNRCFSDACYPSLNGPGGCRVDFLLGYRFYRLSDGVAINENLNAISPPGAFIVNDSFASRNLFNGVEFGTQLQTYRGQWTAELIGKIAMGNNNQQVTINGSTDTTQNGATTHSVGGLLAQPSNIGVYQRNEFAVVPQLNANLLYQVSPRLRLVAGYSFVYWSRVVRAGDIIDLDVNSNVLPNHPPVTGPIGDTRHPQFVFRDTDFWAQGINVGLDYRW